MIRALALSTVLIAGLAAPAAAQSSLNLLGSYTYTGTETDGSSYDKPGTLVISAEKSGALGLKWDGGEFVGVGQVTGNVLAVAAIADGKNTIMLMNINPDGSLQGPWWRRADAGKQGTETWKKK